MRRTQSGSVRWAGTTEIWAKRQLCPASSLSIGGFTRQFFVQHRGLVEKGRHDDRGLLEVIALDAIEDIGVGMMGAGHVIDWVLDELKSRQADAIEGKMIRAGGVRERQGFRAEIIERLKPAAKERAHGFVALHVNTANFSGAVVEIEVGGQFIVFELAHELARGRRVRSRSEE